MTQSLPEKERLTTRFWWKCPLCELEFDNGVLAQAHYDEPCKATQVKEAIQRTHEKQGDGYFTHPDIATMQDAARAYVDRPQQPPEQCLCGKDAIGETVVCSNCIRKPPDNGEVAEAIKTVEEYAMTIAEGIGSECWEAIYTLIQAAQNSEDAEEGEEKVSKYSKEEIAKIQEDAEWWRMVGKILGLKLIGFTYRDSASFSRDRYVDYPLQGLVKQMTGGCYEIDNYLANAILSASGKI